MTTQTITTIREVLRHELLIHKNILSNYQRFCDRFSNGDDPDKAGFLSGSVGKTAKENIAEVEAALADFESTCWIAEGASSHVESPGESDKPEPKDLKAVLFECASKALDEYLEADREYSIHAEEKGSEGLRIISRARFQRYCAFVDVFRAAGLSDEFQASKDAHP